jgi:hypothetical protein
VEEFPEESLEAWHRRHGLLDATEGEKPSKAP